MKGRQMGDEHTGVREHFAAEPGQGHHAERLLAERENAVNQANTGRVEAIDEQLAALGWQAQASRDEAAAKRRATAKEQREREQAKPDGERKDPAKQPPAGRNAGPARSTAAGKAGKYRQQGRAPVPVAAGSGSPAAPHGYHRHSAPRN